MIDAGMGPVFAFCETGMKCTFIECSIEAKCLDGSAPARCCTSRSRSQPVKAGEGGCPCEQAFVRLVGLGGRELAGDHAEFGDEAAELQDFLRTGEDAAFAGIVVLKHVEDAAGDSVEPLRES